jgi:cytochrome c553
MDCRVEPGNDTRRNLAMRLVTLGILLASAIAMVPFANAADVVAGKAKAEICAACHGENGISQTENIPSLAGQLDQYVQWQLVFFRAGARKNEQMQPIVEQLNNDDIRNLGAYFASLTPFKGGKDDNPDLSEKGKQAAAGRRCASCHGDTFAGTKAVARIAGQREEYLVKALHDYKSGLRSGGAQAAMADVAYPLSDEEITALAHYLAHL